MAKQIIKNTKCLDYKKKIVKMFNRPQNTNSDQIV